ncbi:hypothetical protein ES705_06986 [subsurface metagenome]
MKNPLINLNMDNCKYWLLPIIVLSPSFQLFVGYPCIRIEYIFLFFYIFFSFLKYALAKKIVKPSFDCVGLLFSLMMISCIISIEYSIMFLEYNFKINDFFLIIQLFLYYSIFYIAKTLYTKEGNVFKIYKFLAISGVFVALFSILQYFNILEINRKILVPLYFYNAPLAQTKAFNLVQGVHWRRIVGTFGNPNYCGMFFAILLAATSSYYLFPVKGKLKLHHFFIIEIVIITLIILTGSRTAIFSFVIITVFSLFLGKLKIKKLRYFFIIMIGVIFILVFITPQYFVGRIFSEYTSFHEHLSMFKEAFKEINKSPVLGLGPAKIQLTSTVDNEYLLYWRRYGLIGVILFLLLHVCMFIKGFLKFSKGKITIENNIGLLTMQLAIIWSIFGLTSDVFKNPQMMGIIFFLTGLSWAKLPEEDKK